MNFFTARDVSGKSSLSYINDKKLPKGYKNTIIINELNIDFSEPVIIMEGYFDSFNSKENTIPLCGSSLSVDSFLFKTLVKNNSTVILALDPDAFYKKTLQVAKNLLSYSLDVYFTDFLPYKDAGSAPQKEVISRLDNSIKIDERFIMKQKIQGMYA